MYFTFYPKTAYKINEFDYIKAIDITNAIAVKNYIKKYKGILYNPYTVKDGERPDNISYKLYGSESYAWLILLANDIQSIYDEWPRSYSEFIQYIEKKYGSLSYANSNVKYYYDSMGNVITPETYNTLPANQKSAETFYQYEMRLNDQKARIKLIAPALVPIIETDLKNVLKK